MDPTQWMGAVRMSVQTADKNITIVHKFIKMFYFKPLLDKMPVHYL